MTTPPHFRDTNEWSPLPNTEVNRLQGTLYNHLRKMHFPMSKPDRTKFVQTLLAKQHQTCALGTMVGGKYCWNAPKYSSIGYLKLEWGHIKPRCHLEDQTPADLYLMCARCNNQLQSSRYLHQLEAEFQSKCEHIHAMIS
jgi:hypothetical protein